MIEHLLGKITNRIYAMPVVVLMPHSRCNCRCVMCDIWKANHEKREITAEQLQEHIHAFRKFGVRRVALSGGEALMHANLWNLCDQLLAIGVKISLLSTGILIHANARKIVTHCDDVIVSLDGSREVHNKIRNIPHAFEKLQDGIIALKTEKQDFRVTGRCVLQKSNFRDLPNIIVAAKDLGLDQISFLAADVSSSAFNHGQEWKIENAGGVALDLEEADEFEEIVKRTFLDFENEYRNKFVAEGKKKMLGLAQYYRAIRGQGKFPSLKCNAPWVSAVIESNGDVLPCFFHKPYGNIANGSLEEIVNSTKAIEFRRNLDVQSDETCKKCVCSLYLRS